MIFECFVLWCMSSFSSQNFRLFEFTNTNTNKTRGLLITTNVGFYIGSVSSLSPSHGTASSIEAEVPDYIVKLAVVSVCLRFYNKIADKLVC